MNALIPLALIAAMLAACSRTVYVPVESSAKSSVESSAISSRVDTVINSDTVTIVLTERGDTVTNIVTRWRIRSAIERDTVEIIKADTVFRQAPVEVTKSAKSSANWYDPIIDVAKILGLLAFVLAISSAVNFFLKRKYP